MAALRLCAAAGPELRGRGGSGGPCACCSAEIDIEDRDIAHAALDAAAVERFLKQINEGRVGSLGRRRVSRSVALADLRSV